MNEENYQILLHEAKTKIDKTMILVEASLRNVTAYNIKKMYSPDELEPYDALCDRFIRCVEVYIKYFKTYDRYKSITPTPTYRDLMNIMEKLEIVSSVDTWMNMRDVRNRIVHDYLPTQTKDMFDSIMGKFYQELLYAKEKIERIDFK